MPRDKLACDGEGNRDPLGGPDPIRNMMRRGMADLTGAPDWTSAWKRFVEPGQPAQ